MLAALALSSRGTGEEEGRVMAYFWQASVSEIAGQDPFGGSQKAGSSRLGSGRLLHC